MKHYNIREAAKKDIPFLWDMLYEAASVAPEIRTLGKEAALQVPSIKKYLGDWGRVGDYALIALDTVSHQKVGAAWYRLFPSNERGYGYVADNIPEISMAVIAAARGKGVGSLLLEQLIKYARQQKIPALSLSVDKNNPARKLYEKFGFIDAGISKQEDASVTLVLTL